MPRSASSRTSIPLDLDAIFGTTGHVSWLQECARAVAIFFYGLVLLRLVGPRLFGRWSALDIIVSIIIGSNMSRALTGSADLWGTLAATTVMLLLYWLCIQLVARVPSLSRLLEGRPVAIATDGVLDDAKMRLHGVSETALREALRSAKVDHAGQSRLILLEPSGKISVIPAEQGPDA